MSGYVLSPRAEADLEDIWNYTVQRWSLAQAEAYHDELISAVARVAQAPSLGRDCSHIRAGYRRYHVGSHVIFFAMSAGELVVVRILYKSRDFPRHL